MMMSPFAFRIRKRLSKLGIEHFQLATFDDPAKHARCVVIFDRLVADEQIDVLRALMDKAITWGELLDADTRQELKGTKILAKLKLARPLWETRTSEEGDQPGAIEDTLPRMGRAATTRARYATALEAFRRQTLVPWPHTPMRVRDLRDVRWADLADQWPRSAADWNHVVRAVRAFLTTYLGSVRDPFREEVGALTPLLPEDERVPDITPERFGDILRQMPRHAQAKAMGLLLTGMRDRSEFFTLTETDLLPATYQVRVPGKRTKTKKGRVVAVDPDMWAWIVEAVSVPLGYQQFLRYWHRACVAVGAGAYEPTGTMRRERVKLARGQNYQRRGHRATATPEHVVEYRDVPRLRYRGLVPHDLRHALAQWTHEEGRTLLEIGGVLGHAPRSRMTDRYARQVERQKVAKTAAAVVSRRVLNG